MNELKPCPFCGGTNCGVRAGTDEIWCVCGGHSPHGWNSRPIENKLRDENERLREAIMLLQNWVKAYPLKVFPEPDLKLARKLLTDGGVSYDALNVYSMRHVINGVGKIINETLGEVDE